MPQQPIVVGFDGSDHGMDALALGRALAVALGSPLLVLTAYTPEEWLWSPGTADPMDEGEREALVERAREALAEAAAQIRTIPSPSAAGALHAEAERESAALIVVGSSHHGSLGRLLLGTVTQEVLEAAPCPVAVAPPGYAASPVSAFEKVGIGFDDSPAAHDALALAQRIALAAGADLRILWAAHVTGRALPMAAASYMDPRYLEQIRSRLEERLAAVAEPMRAELTVRTEILPGRTSAALARQTEKLDLLVLGSRGFGPLRRVLLGSVSRGVLTAAHCPVLIARRDAAAEGEEDDGVEAAAAAADQPLGGSVRT